MTIRSIEDTVAIMKDDILHDIHSGIVPRSVRSFSELHDYVDANCYGFMDGFLATLLIWFGPDEDTGWLSDEGFAYVNACQNAINDWLANAGHLLDDMQDQTAASMMD